MHRSPSDLEILNNISSIINYMHLHRKCYLKSDHIIVRLITDGAPFCYTISENIDNDESI